MTANSFIPRYSPLSDPSNLNLVPRAPTAQLGADTGECRKCSGDKAGRQSLDSLPERWPERADIIILHRSVKLTGIRREMLANQIERGTNISGETLYAGPVVQQSAAARSVARDIGTDEKRAIIVVVLAGK